MNRIYLDNASTSFPKAPGTGAAVGEFIENNGVNINRGSYAQAGSAEEMVYETRRYLKDIFGAYDIKHLAFTRNITESLNVVIKGLLRPGDHVLVSAMEHNAVMRPLVQLQSQGVSFDRIPCRRDGTLIIEEMQKLIRPQTRAVIMTCASNVCGTMLPIEEVSGICKKNGLLFILDTAQVGGSMVMDMKGLGADALCFTGHKGLLGPQGIGGFFLRPGLEDEIEPLISGGTGSVSYSEEVPEFMPDRFESGTQNLPGIAGLRHSLSYLKEAGPENLRKHELELTEHFLSELKVLKEKGLLIIAGKEDIKERTAVVSVALTGVDMGEAAFRLDEEYGIMIRSGLHCAPNAHKTLGTFPQGTLRFSFGFRNTHEEIEAAARALAQITCS